MKLIFAILAAVLTVGAFYLTAFALDGIGAPTSDLHANMVVWSVLLSWFGGIFSVVAGVLE